MSTTTRPGRAAALAALLRVVAAAACWALAGVLAKYAFQRGVPPLRLAEARVAVALAVLAPLLAWRRPGLLRPPPGLPLLAGFGACVAAVNASYYLAIDHLPVGVAVALQYTGPSLLLAATALVRRRGPGWLAWAAAGCTLAGAVLVSRALEGVAAVDPVGLLAGLGAAVSFALYLVSAEAAGRRGVEPAAVLLWGFVVAVAAWAVAAPWWSWPLASLRDPSVAAAVAAIGVLGTLVPFFLAVGALRVVSAPAVGIAATFEPVFAAALAWLLLGQRLGAGQLAGGALVVAGVVAAQLASGRAADRIGSSGRRRVREPATKVEVAGGPHDLGADGERRARQGHHRRDA
jgi:drug/metabolite transporter (DMT)-like permease